MKRILTLAMVIVAIFAFVTVAKAGQGTPKGNGWTAYKDVQVTWNGVAADWADWDVYNADGSVNNLNPNALEMAYDFEYKGNTMQFDETYTGVTAYPQTHHVVLTDNDGDGTYTGSITARYDYPASLACPVRMDVIEYTITPENFGTWGSFFYIENEYCLPTE